jgi:GH18 family chitinase
LLYAFAGVDDSGAVWLPTDSSVLGAVQASASAAGARSGILLGGWNDGDDSALTGVMASAESRDRLARSLADTLQRHRLSAVEIDWEYPDDVAQGEQLRQFLLRLRDLLNGQNISIGLSVPALGAHADVIPAGVFDHIDVLSVMAYDNGGERHADRTFFQASLAYWLARGAPAEKIAMGIPAYSRPVPRTFAELVALDPRNAWRDTDGVDNWNGLPTVRWKVRHAERYGSGVMLWELGQDAPRAMSIIREMVQSQGRFSGARQRSTD